MVVTGNHQYATVTRGASHVGMLEDIATAVHARPLAIPQRKYTVILRTGKQVDLLRAPDAGRGQVFVHAGMEFDVGSVKIFFGLGRGLIHGTQWRAAITGDKAGGIAARLHIALMLQYWQPYQCLYAGHENATALQCIFVV